MAAAEPLTLCLDQGGHASRALVFDGRGALVTRALREVRTFHPGPGRVEQDPQELVSSLQQVICEALASLGPRAVALRSAGLATQRSSIVCWDARTGAALSPVLSWQDRRAHDWLRQFSDRAEDIHERTGLRLSAHYGASKLRWCLDHLPAVRSAHAAHRLALGPLVSFLLFHLVPEHPLAADPANASRTLLWNIKTRDWDDELLGLFDVPRAALPPCVPTRHAFGNLSVDGRKIPLTLLTGDQSAALFAFGRPAGDSAFLNLGTGAFVQRATGSQPVHAPGLLTGIAWQDRAEVMYTLEGTVNGAGSALAWVETELGLKDVDGELPAWLAHSQDPPLFLNGISGLGAPYWVADFESRFIGEAEPWEKAVAVAESIVFLLQVNLERIERATGPLRRLVVTGGLSWYDGLCRRLGDLSGVPAFRPAEYEATARGTAFLLAGCPQDWPMSEGVWFRPQPDPALAERYHRWRAALEAAIG
jgi:glycerol kinase